ncbi:hypothetical protein [Algoriphagus vanfongensis]|uniref:hypothetical protein n=1 Tax=Algoriphagus vanfongensis TaxID=426371 RepID=UPI00047E7481|nr:hypothetical protein [Algoriphagus vanfongensis]
MKSQLVLIFLVLLISCGQKSQDSVPTDYVPELVVVDSLVIDHMTELVMLDIKNKQEAYLFYDFKTDELVHVDSQGEIIQKVNLVKDGKDTYKSRYFLSAHFHDDGGFLIITNSKAYYYDVDFNLLRSSDLDFYLVTSSFLKTSALEIFNSYMYTFSVERAETKSISEGENMSTSYPFLASREKETFSIIASAFIPETSKMALHPGKYFALDPYVELRNDKLHVLFPMSPELYVYSFPELMLEKTISLNPNTDHYKQAMPNNPDVNFDGYFEKLASSHYLTFGYSNGYLLTQYDGAAPQDEVEALPKNVLGDAYAGLERKYKSRRFYQVFKDEQKIWEGEWPIKLEKQDGLLYSYNAKAGEDPSAIEKDVQTLYFYELQ